MKVISLYLKTDSDSADGQSGVDHSTTWVPKQILFLHAFLVTWGITGHAGGSMGVQFFNKTLKLSPACFFSPHQTKLLLWKLHRSRNWCLVLAKHLIMILGIKIRSTNHKQRKLKYRAKTCWRILMRFKKRIQKWETQFRETDGWREMCVHAADGVQSAERNQI